MKTLKLSDEEFHRLEAVKGDRDIPQLLMFCVELLVSARASAMREEKKRWRIELEHHLREEAKEDSALFDKLEEWESPDKGYGMSA
jgi:hypothetical protein